MNITVEELVQLVKELANLETKPKWYPMRSQEPVPELKPDEIVKPLSVLDNLSDEEILMYATPRFDEIQAEKEAHKQKLLDEVREHKHG